MNRLTTEDEHRQLLAHGQARAAGEAIDPRPVVRLFTPDAHATWLLAALNPADGDTAWGLIDLGLGMPDLGGNQAVGSGCHRRATPTARDAGPVFPGSTPTVRIPETGPGERLHRRLSRSRSGAAGAH